MHISNENLNKRMHISFVCIVVKLRENCQCSILSTLERKEEEPQSHTQKGRLIEVRKLLIHLREKKKNAHNKIERRKE